ncbi:hypothetical protein B9Z55_016991 [Caenorhabditis nigoni]|uniref:Glucuronosyltransferase n=1 Tax=Caenorhabditis nigoni TaxID=1611254 RepID=A0A2G5T7I3_9PELO|nr:hypothetical protein B9Z55_016991 [Caenorhabditis nigoni]
MFLLFSLLIFGIVNGKNILIINPIFGFSHVKFISQFADVIADHGHNVVIFLSFFPKQYSKLSYSDTFLRYT